MVKMGFLVGGRATLCSKTCHVSTLKSDAGCLWGLNSSLDLQSMHGSVKPQAESNLSCNRLENPGALVPYPSKDSVTEYGWITFRKPAESFSLNSQGLQIYK